MRPLTQDELGRLSYVKRWFEHGCDLIQGERDLQTLALLTFHDALETFLRLCAEVYAVPDLKEVEQFGSLWNKIASAMPGSTLDNRTQLMRLNTARNSLKHRGILPAPDALVGYRNSLASFFEVEAPRLLDIPWNRVSPKLFIRSTAVRSLLDEVEQAMDDGRLDEAQDTLARAVDLIEREGTEDAPQLGLLDPASLSRRLRRLERLVDGLVLGMNPDELAYLQSQLPQVIHTWGGGEPVIMKGNDQSPPSPEVLTYLVDIAIRYAIRRQEPTLQPPEL